MNSDARAVLIDFNKSSAPHDKDNIINLDHRANQASSN